MKRPVRIISDQQRGIYFTFIYDISEEQQKAKQLKLNAVLFIDAIKLVNEKGKAYSLSEEISLPRFSLEVEQDEKTKKVEQEENESEILQKKIEMEEQQKESKEEKGEVVKCKCVHGKCNKGSAVCDKCEYGWEGPLCDISKDSGHINANPRNRRIGDRGNRNRDRDEDSLHSKNLEDNLAQDGYYQPPKKDQNTISREKTQYNGGGGKSVKEQLEK